MTRELEIAAFAALLPGMEPDLGRVAAPARRRLSPLQKVFFALASQVETERAENTVFASRYGEISLTRRLVADFNADGSVSPNRFSTSVYNAAPGLWSVATKNAAPYTAVAAGTDTIECGFLELLSDPVRQLYVYAEEDPCSCGFAILFGPHGTRRVRLSTHAVRTDSAPLAFDAVHAFLSGACPRIEGRYLTLEDAPPCA